MAGLPRLHEQFLQRTPSPSPSLRSTRRPHVGGGHASRVKRSEQNRERLTRPPPPTPWPPQRGIRFIRRSTDSEGRRVETGIIRRAHTRLFRSLPKSRTRSLPKENVANSKREGEVALYTLTLYFLSSLFFFFGIVLECLCF